MPRLKSANQTDKQIPRGPYWDCLRDKLREHGVSSAEYNYEIQRQTNTRGYGEDSHHLQKMMRTKLHGA